MTAARRGPGLALAALAGAVALGLAAAPKAAAGVVVASSGNHSETSETVPISSRARSKQRVAMTIKPRQMPALAQGDRLRLNAELQTTNNCYRRTPFCVGRPYRYSPKIATRLILAGRGATTGGPKALAITRRKVDDCDQDPRNREHHCVRVYMSARLDLDDLEALPCEPSRCRINLVIDAFHPKARSGDVLILGIDRPDGSVSGDRSRLNALRLRGNDHRRRDLRTENRRDARVPIRKGNKTSIYSLPIGVPRKGDRLVVSALARLGIGHLSYPAFTGSQLILAERPGDVSRTALTRRVGSFAGEVTEANGFNCTQRKTPCRAPKAGMFVIRKSPTRNGRPVPLYVNYVLRNAPKQAGRGRTDTMRVLRGGYVEARRYR